MSHPPIGHRIRAAWIAVLIVLLISAAVSPRLLAEDLTGVVVDTQGKPLAGARVDVWTAQPREGKGYMCPSCYLDCAKEAVSDKDGRFVIADVSPKLTLNLLTLGRRLLPHFYREG